jgi:hypothetical protein
MAYRICHRIYLVLNAISQLSKVRLLIRINTNKTRRYAMTDTEVQNLKFDFLWNAVRQLNERMNKLEGVENASALTAEQFIALSQAFRKGLSDGD